MNMKNNVLTNANTQIALIIGAIGGLISDALNSGYFIVIIISAAGILYGWWDEEKKKKLYLQASIPIPLVFNISNPANSKNALTSLFDILNKDYPEHKENLKKYFNIIEDDLLFQYDGDIFDEERFIDFLKISKHEIKKLESQIPKNTHFHIIYIGTIANAIMIGTMLGTEGITIYQYNKSSDSYTISLEISERTYKENVDTNRIIENKKYGKVEDQVTVAIDLASHKVALNKLQEPIIHLQSMLGATIKKPEDFIRANQEIYAVINELQQTTKHIKLVYSMPTSIAILLGMSIQNYWDIELTQFIDGEYKTIIQHLNKIKYYY
jgi:hypothetical protein